MKLKLYSIRQSHGPSLNFNLMAEIFCMDIGNWFLYPTMMHKNAAATSSDNAYLNFNVTSK